MKELCGTYLPFSCVSLPQNLNWTRFFQFITQLSYNDCFHLLDKIREDEKCLEENQDRIQMTYSCLFKLIASRTHNEHQYLQDRIKTLCFLTENNQWRLTNEIYYYVESDGFGSSLNDGIPSLKLDYQNKTDANLVQFLEFFKIRQIRINDLKLVDHQSENAAQFKEKLIQISPFIKTWLKKLRFDSKITLSLDRTLQQEVDFIESDSLELFYHNNLVQETNVYFNSMHQQFYICRPWNSATTVMDLPSKLCKLLNIEGFEEKLRFLLEAQIKEIIKHFTKLSIEIPKKEDTVVLESLPRAGHSNR